MSRSLFKGPFIKNLSKNQKTKNSIILPKDIGKYFKIYNGKFYFNINVKEDMVGFKFGEFTRTRSIFKYKKK